MTLTLNPTTALPACDPRFLQGRLPRADGSLVLPTLATGATDIDPNDLPS